MPGTADDPVRLDPFQTIRSVGWGGRLWLAFNVRGGRANPVSPVKAIIELLTPYGNQLLLDGETILTAQGTPFGAHPINGDGFVSVGMMEERDLWRLTVHPVFAADGEDDVGRVNVAVINIGRIMQGNPDITHITGSIRIDPNGGTGGLFVGRILRSGSATGDQLGYVGFLDNNIGIGLKTVNFFDIPSIGVITEEVFSHEPPQTFDFSYDIANKTLSLT